MTQNERILRHLDTFGSITPMEAMQDYGIMRLGARIWDLKASGVPIKTEWVRARNRFDEPTHYARYSLDQGIKKSAASAATLTTEKTMIKTSTF